MAIKEFTPNTQCKMTGTLRDKIFIVKFANIFFTHKNFECINKAN